MTLKSLRSFIGGSAALSILALTATASVTVSEQQIVIPTYLAGEPEPNPMFYFGRASQGAEGRVYPYPLYDTLTDVKSNKTYRIVYLENEYVRIGILPEIGGRLLEAVDKSNGYNFIYRQHVIKPALIGLIGAWISGGIEWNIPHHHRATTFLSVQYRIVANADGSKTVWVGELELRQRMRWAVGYTLHPGKSFLACSVRILNRTAVANTTLCFANVAVAVNDHYQVIFPPDTQFVTFHGKRDFTTWPLATTRYAGADFTRGVDVSWYSNHLAANSMFAWNYQDDFFAGYDHGRQAGILSIANHQVIPGKKFWTWGTGPRGRMWDKILTDTDGPYIELMVGAYSDNQPDYSWLQPYETKSFEMYWYPFRDIGGVKQANLEAAVNLETPTNGTARIGFCTTTAHRSATVLLKAGERGLLKETVAISPAKPYVKNVSLPAGVEEDQLRASLADGDRELVAYSPVRLKPAKMPEPVTAPPAPADIKTIEELYLAGQRLEQFHNPNQQPEPYWEEALRRDPLDARVNAALGIRKLKQARFTEAEQHFRKAIQRLTFNYTSPKDGEPSYYLGVALLRQSCSLEASSRYRHHELASNSLSSSGGEGRGEEGDHSYRAEYAGHLTNEPLSLTLSPQTGRGNPPASLGGAFEVRPAADAPSGGSGLDPAQASGDDSRPGVSALDYLFQGDDPLAEATDAFYRATWSAAWRSPAYYSLAEIATRRGNFAAALQCVNCSLEANALNVRALGLKAALLRHTGEPKAALEVADSATPLTDPLDVRLMAERWLAGDRKAAAELTATLRHHPATALETAAEYADAGLWQDGAAILELLTRAAEDKARVSPLTYYYLGEFAERLGQSAKAAEYRHLAMELAPDGVFPFQWELISVLQRAGAANPRDARAPYYLGNLLFGGQPEAAVALWERAADLEPSLPLVHRNLAQAYAHQKPTNDLARAVAQLELAVAAPVKYALHFAELDELYAAAGAPPDKRLALLEQNQAVVSKRDDALAREIGLKVFAGKYDEAIRLMTGRRFSVWEGGALDVAVHWVNAHLLRGREELRAGQWAAARADFLAARTIPDNLPAERAVNREAEVAYWLGIACEAAGQAAEAGHFWQQAAEAGVAQTRRGAEDRFSERDVQSYYSALAKRKLGQDAEADATLHGLIDAVKPTLEKPEAPARSDQRHSAMRTALAHYLAGLGHLGLNDDQAARTEFALALQAAPDFLGPKAELMFLP